MQTTNATVRRYRGLKRGAVDITGTDWGNWHVESRAGSYGRNSTWWCVHLVTGERAIKDKDYLREQKAKWQKTTDQKS